MSNPLERFDEARYLQTNPDVAEAVSNGIVSSGLVHYIHHGYRENRSGVAPNVQAAIKEITEAFSQSIPPQQIPPEHLRKRVHGDVGLASFLTIGSIVALDLYSTLNSLTGANENHRVLDFGCGCGRVLRYFKAVYPQSILYGTDIDHEAIAWCQQNLPQFADFRVNGTVPPLPFPAGYFELVYSISVFTHLPEDMELAWLAELRRVTKPGGLLLLTTHGYELFPGDSEEQKRQLQEHGFYYAVGSNTEGLPDFYQTSFHTDEYIYSCWGKILEVVKIIKKGIAGHQDLVVCRKPPVPNT